MAWRWLLLASLLITACDSCSEHVAELEMARGEVERDIHSEREAWRAALVGDRLEMGDGMRTGATGRARLKLSPDGIALVESRTVLRFLDRRPGQTREGISLEEGVIELDADHIDLEVHTPRAIARVVKGSKVRVSARSENERFDVLVGRVAIDHDGTSETVAAGQSVQLGVEPTLAPEPKADLTANAPDSASAAPTAEPVVPAGLGQPDFALTTPENATIHAASVPVVIAVAVPACENGTARLELVGAAKPVPVQVEPGSSQAAVRLGAGSHRLRIRCGKGVASETLLRVQRDPATMELPRSAQRVEVEADGRRYTVHYQNVLPVVSLGWADARPAAKYTLLIKKGTRELRYELSRAQKELRPGELGEGEYHFHFEAGPGVRSPDGALRIVFDNTARSAYLSEPVEGSAAAGDSQAVAGAALLRSDVSVDGVALPLDPQGRFRGSVPRNAGRGALAVRVSHPVTGVHYYLRRVRGAGI